MPTPTRRNFLGGTAAAAAAAGLATALPAVAAAAPARRRGGSLNDIEHVVILMQENRSVDHYYGTMRGVRGFGDAAALTFADGRTVFQQPDASRPDGGFLLPYHVDTAKVDGQDLSGNDHSWEGVHVQWAEGTNQGYVSETGEHSVAFFDTGDIPFHRALAQAFTFCDHYFCSIKGPTTPNRLFLWSGTIDPNGTAGGPAISNPADYIPVYNWTTYPERLQKAGVSWQVFANDEVGDGSGDDGWVGDYGDNPLWLFQAYHDALASTDPAVRQLAKRASLRKEWKPNSGKGHNPRHVLAQFLNACESGTLPAVSWIVAPYAYSEHPSARPVDGAAYTQTVLNAIWAQPDLWHRTVVLINYDEHDGFFDHVVSPTAPPGTPDEFVDELPVGLGPRVPMTVISPWSRGGWINSQVFDHTSVLRFLELWTGVREPNISAWRRRLCGDLSTCFDFSHFDARVPTLPDTAELRRQADRRESKLPVPTPPPPGQQVVPTAEPGTARARSLPYQPWANPSWNGGSLSIAMGNDGDQELQLQVYDLISNVPAQRIDVPGHQHRTAPVGVAAAYRIAVHGPNRFLRQFAGDIASRGIEITMALSGTPSDPRLSIIGQNATQHDVTVQITGITQIRRRMTLTPGSHSLVTDWTPTQHGWYDVTVRLLDDPTFERRFSGHLETGADSITGPQAAPARR